MRVVFAMLLILAAIPARAEWVEIGESVSLTLYMDPATLGKEGNHRKAWVLYDFRRRAASGELSARIFREFDCDRRRVRTLSVDYFPDSMAGGAVLSKSDTPDEWSDVAAKTVNSIELEYACAK